MSPPPEDAGIPVPELLSVLIEMGGSDLHLMAGSPPFVRMHGERVRLEQYTGRGRKAKPPRVARPLAS